MFLFIVIIFFVIRKTNLDILISSKAFSLTDFNEHWFWAFISNTGKYLCLVFILAYGCFIVFSRNRKKVLIKGFLLASLLLIIGPGMINNQVLKPYFNRPRPYQIKNYQESSSISFVPILSRGTEKRGRSFPSGHAGAAFFFIFPWFIQEFREKYRFKVLLPGLFFGLFIGALRILGGHHFLSDIIASFGVVYLSGCLASYLLYCFEMKKIIK